MRKPIWRRFLDWLDATGLPEDAGDNLWDWIQVEVTSSCNASCTYCPRTAFQSFWADRHMPLARFEKLRPAFPRSRMVHLQGWGEPLLNPGVFDMIRMAKEAGTAVGTTTNGTRLDAEHARRLAESGIDLVAFSLAGTAQGHDAARPGTRLENVLKAIRTLRQARDGRGAERPTIHVAYMLLRSGLDELDGLPSLLKDEGVSQVVISVLDFVPSPALCGESLTPSDAAEHDRLRSRLEEVKSGAAALGLPVHYHLGHPERRGKVCAENVQRAIYVSADGAVSPCVYLGVPATEASLFVRGTGRPYRGVRFGGVDDAPLESIWNRDDYAAFRRAFSEGDPPEPCRDCPKLRES